MTHDMLIIDCEATQLMKPQFAPLAQQPYLAEITMLRVDARTLQPILPPVTLQCRPPFPLPEEFVKITGITAEMMMDWPAIFAIWPGIEEQFLGVRYLCAHNVSYDAGVLESEARRLDRVTRFPWPPERCCTVEATKHYTGNFLGLAKLAALLEVPIEETLHRSAADVDLLYSCCVALLARGEWPWA